MKEEKDIMEGSKESSNCNTTEPQHRRTGFKYLDHPSDVGIEVSGNTLKELFINAALGMLSIISDIQPKRKRITKKLHVSEETTEELLHSYLSEILWFVTKERFFPMHITLLTFNDHSLDAELEGVQLKNEEIKSEVKAVTYHQLEIYQKKNIWFTNLIFDV